MNKVLHLRTPEDPDARERATLVSGTVTFGDDEDRAAASAKLAASILGMDAPSATAELTHILQALARAVQWQIKERVKAQTAAAQAVDVLRRAEREVSELRFRVAHLEAVGPPTVPGQAVVRQAVVLGLKFAVRASVGALAALGDTTYVDDEAGPR